MKLYLSLFLIFIFHIGYSQDDHLDPNYVAARSIISSIDTVVTPNGIDERFYAEIGGLKQWISVKGQDKGKPILLFVHGGPGSPLNPVSWIYQKPLEEYFTVVNYDQRGTGKTFAANGTLNLRENMKIEDFVNDVIDITRLLCKKYKKEKVVIVGHSWGTVIATKAIIKHPELFHAYVGIGQVINVLENEKISYEYALQKASEDHNVQAMKALKSIAPYPNGHDLPVEHIIVARKWAQYYGGLSAYRANNDYYFNAALLSPDYSEQDVMAIDNGTFFTLGCVMKELATVDLSNIRRIPIPVIMLCGRHDYTTPTLPTIQWMKKLNAPKKKIVWFENSAHLIPVEEPGKMLITFVNTVLPLGH
ncbi:alpha/beta fold hydrolase [Fulvivirga sediminis]|uniref:Alpha/beta hydrolase n=1 Tax=Fulvivirga sediminis TaxID=2803949 RepID=A0A937F8N9_9BACT|nr:alpha/beta hydrolase [Fulvivirga sediminis]MBL3657211.1 alpha/beta hydrolase [Fulvivirga sediminis]